MTLITSTRLFAALLAACMLVGCGPLTGRAERTLSASEPAPAALAVATSFLDIEITVREGATVDVEARVELRTSGDDQRAEEAIEAFAVRLVRDDRNRLTIRQGDPAKPHDAGLRHSGSGYLRITMPPGVPLEVSSASGDVTLRGDCGAVPLSVRVASGDVRIKEGGASELALTSASGDVDFEGRADRAEVKIASGDLSLRGLAGSAQITSASGDVELGVIQLSDDATISIRSASGSVSIRLPKDAAPRGSIRTASGGIHVSSPATVHQRSATLTGTGGTIEVATASGDVRIRGSE